MAISNANGNIQILPQEIWIPNQTLPLGEIEEIQCHVDKFQSYTTGYQSHPICAGASAGIDTAYISISVPAALLMLLHFGFDENIRPLFNILQDGSIDEFPSSLIIAIIAVSTLIGGLIRAVYKYRQTKQMLEELIKSLEKLQILLKKHQNLSIENDQLASELYGSRESSLRDIHGPKFSANSLEKQSQSSCITKIGSTIDTKGRDICGSLKDGITIALFVVAALVDLGLTGGIISAVAALAYVAFRWYDRRKQRGLKYNAMLINQYKDILDQSCTSLEKQNNQIRSLRDMQRQRVSASKMCI